MRCRGGFEIEDLNREKKVVLKKGCTGCVEEMIFLGVFVMVVYLGVLCWFNAWWGLISSFYLKVVGICFVYGI